jgi:hypothetical protein
MSSNLVKIVVVGFCGLVVVLAIVGYLLLGPEPSPTEEIQLPGEVQQAEPSATPTPTLQEQLSERLAGATLKTSDLPVRELAGELSSHPQLVPWLKNEDLLRRFTAAVDNTADGTSPDTHFEFLRPKEPFKVIERDGNIFIDPACYRRYDLVAEVFVSLKTESAIALYRELRPLINEAYREIAPPGKDFQETLLKTIDELLEVPVLDGEIPVEEKVVTYTYADERLEALSKAQRHLLRTGPDNVRMIQAKLRDIKKELTRAPTPVADPG